MPVYGNPSGPTGGYYNAPQAVPGFDTALDGPTPWSGSWTDATGLNVAQLDGAITYFDSLARTAQTIVAGVSDYDSRYGVSPWGTDGMGSTFETGFKPVADQAVAGLEGLKTLIDNIVAGLTSTRDTLRNTEQANTG